LEKAADLGYGKKKKKGGGVVQAMVMK